MREPAGETWRAGHIVDGRYEVLEELGRGGMSVVHRVRHLGWGSDLAVKSPRRELFQSADARRRFADEAETWVSLGVHPHVCVCHYVRTLDGIPRVFAEYVPGGSLRQWIEDRRLYQDDPSAGLARVLDVAIQVAWGLGHAHGRGLVHQDVKPANVLLGDDGTAKVADFGLARARVMATAPPGLAGGRPDLSVGVSVGGMTRAYASPEQLAGSRVGRRSDVYSLAVSVLEMFTGEVSWMSGPAAAEALACYGAGGGAGVGLPPMPDGLAGLLGRCLCQDPAGRPGSMTEIAAELAGLYQQVTGNAYSRRVPVAADLRADEFNNRALSLLDLGRTDEAGQAFTAALAADPRHLAAVYNAGLYRWRRGEITDEDLVEGLEEARAGTRDRWQAAYLLAQVHLERGDLDAARPLLAEAGRERPGDPEVQAALRISQPGEITSARTRDAPWRRERPVTLPSGIGISADWRLAVTGHPDGTVRLWDLRGGSRLKTLSGHSAEVTHVGISADGGFAVSAGPGESVVRFWDLTSEHCCLWNLGGEAPCDPPWIRSLRLSADGRVVVAATVSGGVWVWEPRSGERRLLLDSRDDFVLDEYRAGEVEVSADGRWALSSSSCPNRSSQVVRLWDLDARDGLRARYAHEMAVHPSTVGAMCFSADGSTAAIASSGRAIWLWELPTGLLASGTCVRRVTADVGRITALSLSRDARLALSGGEDNTVRLWDLENGRCLRTFQGHSDQVRCVVMGADARSGLSAGQDEALRSWAWQLPGGHAAPPQLSRPRPPAELSRLGGVVDALISKAAQAMAAGRYPAALGLLTQARAVPGHDRAPQVLSAWRTLGRSTARTGLRGGWATKVFTEQASWDVWSVDLTPDGRVAVSGGGVLICLWDTASGRCLRKIPDAGTSGSVRLSTDGQRVMYAPLDGSIGVWSAGTGERLRFLDPEQSKRTMGTDAIGSACLSADGRLALVGCFDRAVRLWDLDHARCLLTLAGRHRETPQTVWLSPDGRLGLSADADWLWLWDLERGRGRGRVQHRHGRLHSLCLSADGRLMLSAGWFDPPMKVWSTETCALVRAFEGDPDLVRAARFSPDGRFVVAGCTDGTVRVWDIGSGSCAGVLDGHQAAVRDIALTRDGFLALSGSEDGTVRLWELDWELAADGPADPDGSRMK